MYISAFEISKRSCDCGELVESITPIDNPEKLLPCDKSDEMPKGPLWSEEADSHLKRLIDERTEINASSKGEPVVVRRYIYYKKNELLLVPMPPALQLLIDTVKGLEATGHKIVVHP